MNRAWSVVNRVTGILLIAFALLIALRVGDGQVDPTAGLLISLVMICGGLFLWYVPPSRLGRP